MARVIAHQPAGAAGFGYDPIFYVPALGKTAAELTREEKHAVSHRGQALKLMLDALRDGKLPRSVSTSISLGASRNALIVISTHMR